MIAIAVIFVVNRNILVFNFIFYLVRKLNIGSSIFINFDHFLVNI